MYSGGPSYAKLLPYYCPLGHGETTLTALALPFSFPQIGSATSYHNVIRAPIYPPLSLCKVTTPYSFSVFLM